MISIVPNTARPMRQVRPTIFPFRLRIAEMRCSVRSMPARLSSPNVPMWSTTCCDVALGDLAVEEHDLAVGVARLRPPAEVQDHLDERLAVGQRVDRVDDLGRQRHQERVEVVGRLTAPFGLGHVVPPPAHRTPAGTSAGSATRTRVSFIRSVTLARSSKPLASSSLSIGDS